MKNILLIIFLCVACFAHGEGIANETKYDKLKLNLQSSSYQIRLSAVEDLGKIRDEESINMLISVVADREEDWRIQIRAIKFLGEIGHPKSADILIRAMKDLFTNFECSAIKWNAAIALGNFKKKNAKVVDALINALNDNTLYVREAAIQSLGEIREPQAVSYLIPLLDDKSFAIKISAIQALEKIGDRQAMPFLKHIAIYDPDEHIKAAALKAVKTMKQANQETK